MITIKRTSPLTGKTRTKTIDATREQYENWKNGMLIQNAMPNVSREDREFIISGIVGDEWDKFFHKCE